MSTQRLTLKELVERFGEDATIGISLYSCGSTFVEDLTSESTITTEEENGQTKIIIDAERN